MSILVDLTAPLRQGLPHWPGQHGFSIRLDKSLERGDPATVSTLTLDAHCGTHMDAPVHFVPGGAGAETLALDACVGPCLVADLTSVTGAISASDLDSAGIPAGVERVLAKTRNSGWSRDGEFHEDFCAYDSSSADWLLARGVRLVGIDYLSIEPFGSGKIGHPVHTKLLGAGVVILEGLELDGVEPGAWELLALPLPVVGGDGTPARVLLRR